MSRTHSVRFALALGAAVAVAACKKEAPAPATANVVVINAADYAFTLPDTIPAGVTRFKLVNQGPSLHHAAISRLGEGRTMDSVLAFLHAPPGPLPAWITLIGSPNIPNFGDTTEVIDNLEPGLYAVLCFIPDSAGVPHVAHGMMKQLVVKAATGPSAAEPAADVEVTLTDYDFTFSTPLTAGHHTLKITNTATQEHEMFIARLDSGATVQGLVTWLRSGMKGRPPVTPNGGVVGLAANGGHTLLVMDVRPGTYGLYCFVPDAHDGKEHVDHGMIKQIVVN